MTILPLLHPKNKPSRKLLRVCKTERGRETLKPSPHLPAVPQPPDRGQSPPGAPGAGPEPGGRAAWPCFPSPAPAPAWEAAPQLSANVRPVWRCPRPRSPAEHGRPFEYPARPRRAEGPPRCPRPPATPASLPKREKLFPDERPLAAPPAPRDSHPLSLSPRSERGSSLTSTRQCDQGAPRRAGRAGVPGASMRSGRRGPPSCSARRRRAGAGGRGRPARPCSPRAANSRAAPPCPFLRVRPAPCAGPARPAPRARTALPGPARPAPRALHQDPRVLHPAPCAGPARPASRAHIPRPAPGPARPAPCTLTRAPAPRACTARPGPAGPLPLAPDPAPRASRFAPVRSAHRAGLAPLAAGCEPPLGRQPRGPRRPSLRSAPRYRPPRASPEGTAERGERPEDPAHCPLARPGRGPLCNPRRALRPGPALTRAPRAKFSQTPLLKIRLPQRHQSRFFWILFLFQIPSKS